MILDRGLAALGLKMACEANPSPEDSPTNGTWVCESCSAGGDWLAMRKARSSAHLRSVGFLPHGPQWWLCYAKLGGPEQVTPKYWSWCPGLWGALWGSLETFVLPSPPPSPTPTQKDTQQSRWVMYNFLYEVNAIDLRMICFSCLFFFCQSPSITMRKLEETSNLK